MIKKNRKSRKSLKFKENRVKYLCFYNFSIKKRGRSLLLKRERNQQNSKKQQKKKNRKEIERIQTQANTKIYTKHPKNFHFSRRFFSSFFLVCWRFESIFVFFLMISQIYSLILSNKILLFFYFHSFYRFWWYIIIFMQWYKFFLFLW